MTLLWNRARSLLVVIVLLSSPGCGLSVRSPFTTGSSSSQAVISKQAAVRTADEASQIALKTAQATLSLIDPRVTQVRLMVPDPPRRPLSGRFLPAKSSDDPASLIWLVDLDQNGHRSTPCPAPPPGIDQTVCWYGEVATIAVSVMSGDVVAIRAPYPSQFGTPYAATIGVSPSAELHTREDAMAIGFEMVPGKDGQRPTVIDVRLLSVAEWATWLEQHGSYFDTSAIDPSTPIWELEFTNAALYQRCSMEDQAGCVHNHLFLSLDAMNGKSLGFLFPKAGTPGNYAP